MSLNYSFMDDEKYSAEDVNKIFSRLTTEGVSLFNTSGGNPLSELNRAVSTFADSGVEMYDNNSCMVVYDEEVQSFSISCGTAFMYDGSTVSIEAEPLDITDKITELRKSDEGDIYVGFFRNIEQNRIDVFADTDFEKISAGQGYIILAKILSDNSITDLRKIASTKLAPCSANVIEERPISFPEQMKYNYDTSKKLIKTFGNIFAGATKMLAMGYREGYTQYKGCLVDITSVEVHDEEGNLDDSRLSYVKVDDSCNMLLAANRDGNDIQVWESSTSQTASGYSFKLYFF